MFGESTGQIAGLVIASLLVIGSGIAMSVHFGRKAKSAQDSTIVSTTGSALQSVVANLTHDVYRTIAGREAGERRAVTLSRLTPAAAIGGMLAGLLGCAVAQVLGTAVPCAIYGIGASAAVLLAIALCSGQSSERVHDEIKEEQA